MEEHKAVYNSLYESIFTSGKMMLSPEIDSCDFHAMNHKDTEILGMFFDAIPLSNTEDLKRILIEGYIALLQERSHKLSGYKEK